MSELFSAAELIGSLLRIGRGTYKTAKFVGKVGYGAYAKSKEQEEIERLQRQAIVDETGVLERQARLGYEDKQYEYGKALYCYGDAFGLYKDKYEGLQWIKKAAANGYGLAKDFLYFFDED